MNGSSTTGALLDPPATLCFTFVTRQKILTILTFLPSQLGDRRIREAASLSLPPVGGKDRRLNKIAGAILGDIFAGHGPPNQRPQVTGARNAALGGLFNDKFTPITKSINKCCAATSIQPKFGPELPIGPWRV